MPSGARHAAQNYQFPAGSGSVEFNWGSHSKSVDLDLTTRGGFLDLGNVVSTGTIVSLAVGANVVLIPNKLEGGGVYSTPIATQRDFDFDGFLVKMMLRY